MEAEQLLAISDSKANNQFIGELLLGADEEIREIRMAMDKGISVTRRMAELHLKHRRSILVDYTINPYKAGGEVSALLELNSLEHAQRINQEEILSGARATTQELVRGLAHEIKNPLTPIQLSSERLERKINTLGYKNDDINECIDTIRRQVNEIGYLVDEFSSFARMPVPNVSTNNISQIIQNVISDYKKNHSQINFSNNLHSENIELKIDKSQISRVFQNIIMNSIHSIEEKNNDDGMIVVASHDEGSSIAITITDNGIGLKYEKDELIKPYFTTKKKIGGTGLGLPIVEKILFDHHADFTITNRNDGNVGAEVLIRFEK